MDNLIIIGASGFGREVAWLVERINNADLNQKVWNIVGFIDDNKKIWNTQVDGYKVLGGTDLISQYSDAYFVCAVGAALVRKNIIQNVKSILPQAKFAKLIDPSAILSERVNIGEGSIICAGSIVTVDISIGKHVIINLDSTIGHDAVISDYVTIYPSANISGNTFFGTCVELGTGVQIIQGKVIGCQTIVGAGAVVVKDLPEKCTAVGNPAKPIKYHN